MKLTKSTLKRLIKEEIESLLDENFISGAAKKAGEALGDAAASGYGKETDDEMAAVHKSFSDAGADSLDKPENRELMQNLYKIQADVDEYIKQGEFGGARKHVNAAWKSGAFGKNPEFAKAQWRRLRRMVANAKRKAGRRSRKSAMAPGEGKPSVNPDGTLKGGDVSAAMGGLSE